MKKIITTLLMLTVIFQLQMLAQNVKQHTVLQTAKQNTTIQKKKKKEKKGASTLSSPSLTTVWETTKPLKYTTQKTPQ